MAAANPLSGEPEVSVFAPVNGRSNVGITWPGGARVLVRAESEGDPEEIAAMLAARPDLAGIAAARAADRQHASDLAALADSLRADVARLTAEKAALTAKIPPTDPTRLLGVGCVREDPKGRGLYLLSKAETGWAAFGIRLDGWDDLFRRFDVVIDAPRTDEHGQWWPASPRMVRL